MKTSKPSTLVLLTSVLTSAINGLDKNMHVLDSVTEFDSVDEETNLRLLDKHKMTIHRLDGLVGLMRNAEHSGERSVRLDPMQMHSVNRAVLEKIAELDKAMAYFCQMGESEMVVRSFQKQIEALHMAVFEANSWVGY